MNRFVYVDHAATTPLDQEAYEAMRPFLMNDYANASQNYSFAKKSRRALNEARSTIASCIGAEFEEIVFTSGGSESNNWAIKGRASSWREKREIITTTIEHHSILRACQAVQKSGYSIKYLQTDKDGIVEKEKLLSSITQHTDLVSIMMANNEIGTLQNLSPLVSIAHTNGALFHTDAVQAIGHVKIDVKQIGVDLLSASAHKFNGPKGIGFLYIRKGTEIDPLISGGKQEFGWRAGTENVASIVGMACALKKNTEQLEQNIGQIKKLEKMLIMGLTSRGIAFVRNGSRSHIPGNISIAFPNHNGWVIQNCLDMQGICVSTGAACNSGAEQESHVLKAIGLDSGLRKGTIRISLGKDNTEDDVNTIIFALCKILNNS